MVAGKICGAMLSSGKRCQRKVADNKTGCIYHPSGVGVTNNKKSSSLHSSTALNPQGDFSSLKKEHFDKYAVDPEDILLPTKEEYYAATEKKHFGDTSNPGSQFTELSTLDEFLELAQEQKDKGFMDDDREWYVNNGVNPDALREGIRYIKVDTPGVLGSGDSTQLKDDDVVIPVRKSTRKGSNEYRFSFPVDEKPEVDHATLIISDDVENYNYTPEMLEALDGKIPPAIFFTCYPGSPGAFRGGVRDEKLEKLEKRLSTNSSPLTVAEVKREYFDGNDFGINYATE